MNLNYFKSFVCLRTYAHMIACMFVYECEGEGRNFISLDVADNV